MRRRPFLLSFGAAFLCPLWGGAQDLVLRDAADLSIENELQLARSRALEYLRTRENPSGRWAHESSEKVTEADALGALALLVSRAPEGALAEPRARASTALRASLAHASEMETTALAVATLALRRLGEPQDQAKLKDARRHLASRQVLDGSPELVGAFVREHGRRGQGASKGEVLRLDRLPWVVQALTGDAARDAEAAWRPELLHKYVQRCESQGAGAGAFRPFATAREASTLAATAAARALLEGGEPPLNRATAYLAKAFPPADHLDAAESGGGETELLLALSLTSKPEPPLLLDGGQLIPWARRLAERLINGQNGDGSWPAAPPERDLQAADGRAQSIAATARGLLALNLIERGL